MVLDVIVDQGEVVQQFDGCRHRHRLAWITKCGVAATQTKLWPDAFSRWGARRLKLLIDETEVIAQNVVDREIRFSDWLRS